MNDNLRELLLYLVIGLIGVIASAIKNKQKRIQAGQKAKPVPQDTEAPHDFGPELGPLMELFDIPRVSREPVPDTVESGPSEEYEGMLVDSPESEVELKGMDAEEEGKYVDAVPAPVDFQEGQSDIQKMIARYDAIRRDLEKDYEQDHIASGEIVSVEEEEAALLRAPVRERTFDLRKAIIYSEILKRKEY